VGLLSGIGLLLIATALPVLAGNGFSTRLLALTQCLSLGAAGIGGVAIAASWLATRCSSPLPPLLVGVGSAALLYSGLLALGVYASLLGARAAMPELPMPWLAQLPAAAPGFVDLLLWPVLSLLGMFALTVAVLSSLDTLLVSSVMDGRLRLPSRDANRELRAQGLANMVVALSGGLANSPAVLRSLDLVLQFPAQRLSVRWYGVALLAVLFFGSGLLALIPLSAVGGVLVLQAVQMVAPALWRTPVLLWGSGLARRQQGPDGGQHRILLENWLVAAAVALSKVLFGLGPAVLVGTSLAILLFMRANTRDLVRHVRGGDQRRSLKMRVPEAEALLRRGGWRIAILELEGALFFGTADALRARLEGLAEGVDSAVLDLYQVPDIDATGARILLEMGEDWARRGKLLVAAEWPAGDPRRRTVEMMATPGLQRSRLQAGQGLSFAADTDTDLALEAAEDRLLAVSGLQPDQQKSLSLGQTLLGWGLSPADLAALAAQMTTVHFKAQQSLFHAGDPGDALYVSLRGDIGLRLPGSQRRLASFAPGVCLGEMAVLAHLPRSADAFAEGDLTVMRLSAEAFDRMRHEQPALAAQLLCNISLHLAGRVRVLTTELSAWVTRSAVARETTLPGGLAGPAIEDRV
jgi:SulP family sulfate permease